MLATIDIVLQANARLTNVGISLHKQGQVLDHVRQQTEKFADEPPPDVSDEIPVLDSLLTEETDSERALALLKRQKQKVINVSVIFHKLNIFSIHIDVIVFSH